MWSNWVSSLVLSYKLETNLMSNYVARIIYEMKDL